MGQEVKLVVGVWEQVGHGGWLFLEDPTERKHEIMVHENQTYVTLVDLVRTRYSVALETAVCLTYEFPECMKEPGDISVPPLDVKADGDVELFMSILFELKKTRLLVTIGNEVVARYLFQRRDNHTVIGSSEGVLASKNHSYQGTGSRNLMGFSLGGNGMRGGVPEEKSYWDRMLGQGWVNEAEMYISNLCNNEERVLHGGIPVVQGVGDNSAETSMGSDSGSGSSNSTAAVVPEMIETQVIPLADEEAVVPTTQSLALTIIEPQPHRKRASILDYIRKGKEKVGDEGEPKKFRSFPGGSGSPLNSNPYFPDPIPDADTSEEDDGDEDEIKHLFVGQVFIDRTAFKTHMSLYALANKFRFLCRRSEPAKMVLECRGCECKWRVSASRMAGCDRFQIKRLEDEHSCTVDERGDYKRHATSNLIGEMVRNKYGSGGIGPKPRTLREFMRTDHHVPISYWKAWKSRELAMERGLGNTAEAYRLLPSYLSQLAHANPGTVVYVETTGGGEEVQRFKYLFLSFGASAKGYSYMRKVIVVDGTHLKGKYSGCLLTASAQDGNYQIFPIAFGVVDGENDMAWSWFFQKLRDVVPDGHDLVFVSDRHNSIYAGIGKWYPEAKHFACILHLQRNIVSMFKKKHLAYLVSRAARAYRVCDFYKHFNELKMIDINCADYLIRIGFEHWGRSHSTGMRYNLMTSNVAESLNAALSEAREYPIVALVEYIRGMLMGWFSVRREASANCGGLVTPKVEELLSRNFNVSTGYFVRNITKTEFEVRVKEGVTFCVDLEGKSCTCLEFEMLRIPCAHAVAAALHSLQRVDMLVGGEFSRNNWAAAYSGTINPPGEAVATPNEDDTLAGLQLAPPNTRRPPGRPKKSRYLSRGEFKRGVFGRKKRTCKRCGGTDHNRATCKMPI